MPRRVTVLLLATLSVLGALAPAAFALSHEAQPFGTTVVSLGAGLKPPCE
jgi:hypothetical protein